MNRKRCSDYSKRIELLLALMTKNYEKAAELGNLVLQQHPTDAHLAEVVSLLNENVRKSSPTSSSCSDDDSEAEDNTETSCDTSNDECESDNEDTKDDKDDDNDDAVSLTVDTSGKYPQKGKPPKKLSEYFKESLAALTGNKEDIKNLNFGEKMYRVISVKTKKSLEYI